MTATAVAERVKRAVLESRPRGPWQWLTVLALASAATCVAWPLLGCHALPFVDYPEHVGTVGVLHGLHDPRFSRYFVSQLAGSQYILFYVVADWLSYPFGVVLGTKLTTVLSLASLPIAVGTYLRANGRPAIFGALSAAVAIHVFVFWGFVNYAMGTSIAVFALAGLTRLVARRTITNAAVFGVLAVLTFYAHAQLYVWLVVASLLTVVAGVRAVGWGGAWQAAWRGLVAAVPSGLATMWWLHSSRVIEQGEAGLRSGMAQPSDVGAQYARVTDILHGFWDQSFGFYRDGQGELVGAAFLFGTLLAVAMRGGLATISREPNTKAVPLRTYGPELVVIMTFAAWLFAPNSYKLIGPINDRFLVVGLALLPMLGPIVPLRPTGTVVAAVVSVAVATFACSVHGAHFARTDEELGELDEALDHAAPGKRLMGLIFDKQSEVVPYALYMHTHQYYQARRGGMAAWGFVELPKSPIKYREGAAPTPFPPRFEWTPERFNWSTWGEEFDYFLVRTSPGAQAPLFYPPAAPNAPRLVFEGPRWKLFERR